ncbi:class I SAM-dependent methyltransferase [Deinococcus rubellus]|uniref:Methyltransferase domain-containing protein n=1 Tax=Deinococcus rubellus TaxID=1889240 RepID=A0ABY5YFQ9_9DEIO|nr:class I SAM-dependent methyltransferase [Deinococcus rubellus]UWX63920.1 methyltransferase domain-containing protein [Deinococcus rubellus]
MCIPPSPEASYYDQHAETFEDQTLHLDMEGLYAPFLSRLPSSASILDAGCGPGRDALAFGQRGYSVDAFDASHEMARRASLRLGQYVPQARFQDLEGEAKYDGIWACASLLHVPRPELPGVFQRIERALKPTGVLYASFKYGQGEMLRGTRRFTDLNETLLEAVVRGTATLRLSQSWITADIRPGRKEERWLNALVVKTLLVK